MAEHTPTPWYHRQAGELGKLGQPYDWIGDSPNRGEHRRIIVERNSCEPADYAFIVQAVNNHDDLVNALHCLVEKYGGLGVSPEVVRAKAVLAAVVSSMKVTGE